MGATSLQETHEKRSSSIDFKLPWKHGTRKFIIIGALFSFALAFMFFMLLQGTATKRIALVVNGEESVVLTRQDILEQLLDERMIPYSEHDRISLPLNIRLRNGDTVAINHTTPVQLTVDGQTDTLYTTAKTIADALDDLNITVGSLDKVNPPPQTALADGSEIKIVRVKKEIVDETLPIAFETVTRTDGNLLKGKQEIVQEGREGTKIVFTENVYEDGVLVSATKVDEAIAEDSVNEIVAVGTRAPVVTVLSNPAPVVNNTTKNGVNFTYNKILNNVTLTAYTAGVESTGKDENHPQYGITSTGTTVSEGRTIAVDKNVIPLGWWVYIDGLGFRRAEDTGSSIRGNKVDVYFDSVDYAMKFGIKRGYTVYVIGPKKPTAD